MAANDCSPPVANLGRRFGAMLYDTFLLFGLLFAAAALLMPFTGGEAIRPGNPFFTAYLILVIYFFFAWCWTQSGQTLGMQAWKIRIQKIDGSRVTWLQALIRLSTALLSGLLLGMGFWWMLFDRERLNWHERLSKTRTVFIGMGRRGGERT